MAETIEPSGEIVPGTALVPYVHPTLTNKTPVVWPLLVSAFSAWAILMIEWGSLRWVEHAPGWAWIASTLIAVCVLAVTQNREWLNFRGRRYFPYFLSLLMLSWIGVVGGAYYQVRNSPQPISDPIVIDLQSKLAAALRERDLAISQRDSAMRGGTSPSQPIPSIPPSIGKDEIDARIDAWNSVDAQLNDLSRILSEGENMVSAWKTQNRGTLLASVNKVRSDELTLRDRFQQLINVNSQFSDLHVIDQNAMNRLANFLTNLLQAVEQTPDDVSKDDLVADVAPFIGPIQREIASLKQWSQITKNVAESSVLDLRSRQSAK